MAGLSDHYDAREGVDPMERELAHFRELPRIIAAAKMAPAWQAYLAEVDPASVTSREKLAELPVLRKSALPELQRSSPPFGGLSRFTTRNV